MGVEGFSLKLFYIVNTFSPKRGPMWVATASVAFAFGSMAPAQAFIIPGTTPTSTSTYSQYQNYATANPWISIDQVSYGVGTGIETSRVIYSGQYDSTVTGVFGLWQVGNPAEVTAGGGAQFLV